MLNCTLLDSQVSNLNFQVAKGFALSASDKLVACACSNGIVLLFTSETLNYVGSLLYSKAKSCQAGTDVYHPSAPEKDFQLLPALPDAVACQFSTSENLGKYLIGVLLMGLFL